MFTMYVNNPRLARWQNRLARIPRWAWIAFFLGAVIPIAVVMIILFGVFVFSGLAVLVAVLLVRRALRLFRRGHYRHERLPQNQIIVRSVRVIDP
jgi:hypothetical protein